MPEAKRAAVMIYPYFSLQEITCLSSALTLGFEWQLDVFASSKTVMMSEDGFQVTANKAFDEFVAEAYDCLILPGIINPMPALFDGENIRFLRALAGKDILIAAISSSPLLLAKAGLLENHQFTSGVFNEMLQYMDFVPKENIVRAPIVRDGNLITAVGFAFREFATEVLRAVGIECEQTIYQGLTKEYTAQEMTFEMGEDNFREFLEEYNGYLEKQSE